MYVGGPIAEPKTASFSGTLTSLLNTAGSGELVDANTLAYTVSRSVPGVLCWRRDFIMLAIIPSHVLKDTAFFSHQL